MLSILPIQRLRVTILSAAASLLLPFTGCARGSHPSTTSTASARPTVIGEIAVVDEGKHFVLIDLDPYLYVPSPGTALRATNATGKVAHLKASPEQKRPFIAADIIDGDPVVGDQVVK